MTSPGHSGARVTIAAIAACLGLAAAGGACGDGEGEDPGAPAAPAVEAPAAPSKFYGIATQAPLTDEDLDMMESGGIGSLRAFFAWSALDPTAAPDDYDWSGPDAMVAGAAARGIEVLPYLFASPEWVAKLDYPDCDPAIECAIAAPVGDEATAAWSGFVGDVVDRYGPDGKFWSENPDLPETPIRHWQIWNEQNSPSQYGPTPDVEDYAALLEAAAAEIRPRDPEAEIILGGMFGTPFHGRPPAFAASEFLRRLYAIPGTRENFDGVSAHPYAGKVASVEEQMTTLRDEIDRAGDDASLWVTEVGWSSSEGDSPQERGVDGQAESLADAYQLFLEHRDEWQLQAVIWYSWRDYTAGVICDWCAHSGLFEEATLTPKPAWETFESLPREPG